MTCYQISRDGESIALVADIEIARAIVRCQPWGYYLVDAIEVDDGVPLREWRRKRSVEDHAGDRHRRHPAERSRRRVPTPASVETERVHYGLR